MPPTPPQWYKTIESSRIIHVMFLMSPPNHQPKKQHHRKPSVVVVRIARIHPRRCLPSLARSLRRGSAASRGDEEISQGVARLSRHAFAQHGCHHEQRFLSQVQKVSRGRRVLQWRTELFSELRTQIRQFRGWRRVSGGDHRSRVSRVEL